MKKHIFSTSFALSLTILLASSGLDAGVYLDTKLSINQCTQWCNKLTIKLMTKLQEAPQQTILVLNWQNPKAKIALKPKPQDILSTELDKETIAATPTSNQFLNSIQLAQHNLKPISEQEKNTFSKSLLARRDKYNAQTDLESFIKKLRINDYVTLVNRTNENATLEIQLDSINQAEQLTDKQLITLVPGQQYILNQNNLTYLKSIKLIGSENFLNPKWHDSKSLIFIESTQDKNFLHQYHGFEFTSKPYTPAELENPNQTEKEKTFKYQFNGHIQYVDQILARAEGLTLQSIDEHRQKLFTKNNIAKILEQDSEAIDRYENKIPLITHKIWVTSDDKPVSLPNYYLKWFENSIEHNPTSEGWTHFLWIESKEKLPELAQKLANHPNIKIMELKDMPLPLISGNLYKEAIANKQFGKATDILRLEILKQFGGFYLDTDYELFQSLKPYSKVYDMVVAVEPMSAFLCNAFIGACPNHPVVDKGLEMIMRNMNPETTPDYIKNNNDRGFKTIIETGPAMLTAAFALAGGKNGNVDIAMPPMIIYPTSINEYPNDQVVKPGKTIPAQAIGAHYWETAWMRAEFGSAG